MSIYNQPEFQVLVKKAKLLRILNLVRCIYCWAFLLLPITYLGWAMDNLNVFWMRVYVLFLLAGLPIGIVLWCKGINGLTHPLHKPMNKFIKKPSEAGLRTVCATFVTLRKEKKHPREEYDLMRKAHAVAQHNPDIVSKELFDFFTSILRACQVAGI